MAKSNGKAVLVSQLTDKQKKALAGPALSNEFSPYDRLFPDFKSGKVFDVDWDLRNYETMLKRHGKARAAKQVLTLPLRGAKWEIQGNGPGADLVRDNLSDKLDLVIAQMTGAITYRRAFFELVWKLDGGRVLIDKVAWRPPTGCEAGFDPKTGEPQGFRQRVAHPDGKTLVAEGRTTAPGYVDIPANRAFVYTHGVADDPIHGVSDLDVAYWIWETQQKVLFLWFQFLEKQSLPNVLVYGDDPTSADKNAEEIADMKAGGVLGVPRQGDPTAKMFDILESSGKGADQFVEAVRYLDEQIPSSVLSGFTELATATTSGSYALSADQSDFFLASRQGVADEMTDAIERDLFTPLVRYNLGADADIPMLKIGPLSNKDTDRALDTLKAVITAKTLNVPSAFVDQLVLSTAAYLGLDEDETRQAIDEYAEQRAEQDALEQRAQQAQVKQQEKTADAPTGTPQNAAHMGRAVRAAEKLVNEKRAA